MANGVPVRLSEDLATRARAVASVQERSMTEQVEHWARLGQAVESVVTTETVQRLKLRSHDPRLAERLAFAKSADGRASAAAFIASRDSVRYGVDAKGKIRAVRAKSKKARR